MKMTDAEFLRNVAKGMGLQHTDRLCQIADRLEQAEMAARLNHDTIVAQQDTKGEEQDG